MTILLESRLLNPFEGKQTGKEPENQENITIEPDELVEEAFEKYSSIDLSKYKYADMAWKDIYKMKFPILDPMQLDVLLQKIIHSRRLHNPFAGGMFINYMIWRAYEKGFDDFMLTTNDADITCLGHKCKSVGKRRLKLRMDGNVGTSFGCEAERSDFVIIGDVDNGLASNSEASRYEVYGTIYGDFGKHCKDCTFIIYGDAEGDSYIRAWYSRVKTPHKEVYDKLIERLPYLYGPRVELIK